MTPPAVLAPSVALERIENELRGPKLLFDSDRRRLADELATLLQQLAGAENRAELLAEDAECFHMAMDDLGAPRADAGDCIYSMTGRVNKLIEAKLAAQAAEIELMREEVQDVSVEIEQARRTAEFWKAEHLAGNKLIEAAKRECKCGVFDANDPHTSWCPAKSDLPSWYEYWIGKGRSDIANDYDAFQLAEKWAAANALRVQP